MGKWANGQMGAKTLYANFMDTKTLKVKEKISFKVVDEVGIIETNKVQDLNKKLKSKSFRQMIPVGFSSWEGNDPSPGQAFGLDYNYNKDKGLIQLSVSTTKKILIQKKFKKIDFGCASGPMGKSYPNTVSAWATPDKSTFLFLVAAIGASDSCTDLHQIEVFHAE